METVARPFIGDTECGLNSATSHQVSKWSKKARTIFILSILFLASLVGALDSTIVTTLTHTIMSDLESSSVVSWLGASYLIATALVQPLCGQFSDIYTRRACLLVGSIAFLLGNFTCSIAKSLAFLVVGRALSGIGGGILTIMATIVLTDVTRPEARGLWQGINNIVFGFGHGSGGLFGGLVAHHWSWRVAFMSLSFPAFLIMLGAAFLPEPVRRHNQITTMASVEAEPTTSSSEHVPLLPKLKSRRRKVDATGTILLCLGLGSLLASSQQLELGNSNLDLRLVSFGFVISVIMLTAFSYHSIFMTKDALLPLRLLTKSPSVGYSCLITFLSQFGFTISEFYLPYFVSLQEHTEMEVVGWCLVPLSVGAAAGSFFAGYLTSRFNTSRLLLGSSAVAFIGTLGVPLTPHGTSYAWAYQIIFIFLWGFGFGGLATASLVRMLDSAEVSIQASATSLLYTSRSLGGALGLPVASSVFHMVGQQQFELLLEKLATLENRQSLLPHIREIAQALLAHQPTHLRLPSSWHTKIRDCELFSVTLLFIIPAISGCALFMISVLVNRRQQCSS